MVVNKEKSFDKSFKGDFNLKNNLIHRNKGNNFQYIYTGIQIIKPEVFLDLNSKVFSINKIWDNLIKTEDLSGVESKNNFLHVSTLNIYKDFLPINLFTKLKRAGSSIRDYIRDNPSEILLTTIAILMVDVEDSLDSIEDWSDELMG